MIVSSVEFHTPHESFKIDWSSYATSAGQRHFFPNIEKLFESLPEEP